MAEQLDPQYAELLTEEERAAIADELSPGEVETLKAVAAAAEAGDDDDEDDDDKDGAEDGKANASSGSEAAGEGDGEGAADAAAADAGEQVPAAQAESGDAGSQDGEPVDTAAALAENDAALEPVYVAPLPEDFQQRLDKVNADREDAAKQFQAGEIEFEEYRKKTADIEAEARKLEGIQLKHDVAVDMANQQRERAWNAAVNKLADLAKADGIDYRADKGKQADLDAFLKVLGSNPDNNDKPASWFLTEANRRVMALHGITPKKAEAKPAAAAAVEKPDLKKAAAATRKPNLSGAPQTLANVPGGDGPGDVGEEFADLDRLNGEALEAAIAKMARTDPAAYQRYMAGS